MITEIELPIQAAQVLDLFTADDGVFAAPAYISTADGGWWEGADYHSIIRIGGLPRLDLAPGAWSPLASEWHRFCDLPPVWRKNESLSLLIKPGWPDTAKVWPMDAGTETPPLSWHMHHRLGKIGKILRLSRLGYGASWHFQGAAGPRSQIKAVLSREDTGLRIEVVMMPRTDPPVAPMVWR